jgi:translation initiation factor 2 beta subunit (eIF-2beta)/eIF-5
MSKKDMINVNGTTDPFYRYVMPKMEIKVEGTNKMIRTYIMNINIIAECLNRTTEYINTYLGQELSVNQCYDKQTERFYVSGKYDQQKIQSVLQKMINAFVLCKKCGNPETVNTIVGKKKNTTVNLICRSCGHVVELDNTDKFVKYIILHTPKIDTLYTEQKQKEEVQEREEVQEQGNGGEQGGNGGGEQGDGGEVQEKGESDNESIDLDNI